MKTTNSPAPDQCDWFSGGIVLVLLRTNASFTTCSQQALVPAEAPGAAYTTLKEDRSHLL